MALLFSAATHPSKNFPEMYHPTLRPKRQHVTTSVRPNRIHTKVKFRFHNLHLALSNLHDNRLEGKQNTATEFKRVKLFGQQVGLLILSKTNVTRQVAAEALLYAMNETI